MAIISHLQGGLGNQMFQYAMGRALSERYQTPLLLDCSWFKSTPNGSTVREFQLPLLKIPNIDSILKNQTLPLGRYGRILQKIIPFGPLVLREKEGFKFDSKILSLGKDVRRNIHLIGYWQSYKYINGIRPQLQIVFQSNSPISAHYEDYLQKITSTESTMVHIRRGDYVALESANQYHKPLEISYYLNALKEMQTKKPSTHFFVFSDDLVWAKKMLPKDLPITFIENAQTPEAAVQELQLMMHCKNHIIANSSLSWWGAWLKKDSGGLIYAPSRWIRDTKLNLDDLLPNNWNRLSTD